MTPGGPGRRRRARRHPRVHRPVLRAARGHAYNAVTLWAAHAWALDAFDSTPRLAFLSPEPGSGKTRALEILTLLVPWPMHAVNATPAALFRSVADPATRRTILFDEIDTIFGPKAKEHEELRGLLNAGHRRVRGRLPLRRRRHPTNVAEFPAYAAVALAGLGKLPDTDPDPLRRDPDAPPRPARARRALPGPHPRTRGPQTGAACSATGPPPPPTRWPGLAATCRPASPTGPPTCGNPC